METGMERRNFCRWSGKAFLEKQCWNRDLEDKKVSTQTTWEKSLAAVGTAHVKA